MSTLFLARHMTRFLLRVVHSSIQGLHSHNVSVGQHLRLSMSRAAKDSRARLVGSGTTFRVPSSFMNQSVPFPATASVYHPPTMYFPLTVPEALMIEPTETESKETLDGFIIAMIEIAELAKTNPEKITSCPKTTPVGRLDETLAAREPDLAASPA